MPEDERDRKLHEICSAAMKRSASVRADFLRHACGEDAKLRREAESLLGYEQKLVGFLETPALQRVAPGPAIGRERSLAGQTLGPYNVLSLLGAGGMGEVYAARDTRLGRLVALKTLHPEVAADLERKRRLLLEAQAASALNDPRIVALYDVGGADGIDFLVMEYVEGQTLDKMIAPGGLEIQQAFTYAIATAGALIIAHKAGIIHRDLKPGNIMVTAQGAVKVLDFGLAKLTEAPQESVPEGTGSLVSIAGLILGTAAYMSPEQAQGRTVDTRSDIFSFGVVLYEMLTGQRPFRGPDRTSTLAAIVRQEPKPLSELNAKIRGELESLVLRCLRKDPNERFQDMADVRVALEGLQPAKMAASRRSWLGVAAAGILILTAGLAAYQWLRTYPEGKASRELPERQITSNPIEDWVAAAAISPDGKQVAYRDQSGFLLRGIDSGETSPIPLPRELRNPSAGALRWFPQGEKLLADFVTSEGSAIWIIPLRGGAPPHMVYGLGSDPAISPDGQSIAFLNGQWDTYGKELWVGGVDGSAPRRLATGDGPQNFFSPIWSPDGRWIAYQRIEATKDGSFSTAIEVRPASGGPARTLISESSLPRSPCCLYPWWGATVWSPDWRLIFPVVKEGLWEIRVDPTKCEARGKPERLTPRTGASAVSVRQMRDEWFGTLSTSADGKRLAFVKVRNQWSVDVGELGAGGSSLKAPRRLTLDDRDSTFSAWTRDSKAVLFFSNRNGTSEIFRQELNETVPETVVTSAANAWGAWPSADGAWLFHFQQERTSAGPAASAPPVRLMRRPVADGSPETGVEIPGAMMDLRCPLNPGSPCAFRRTEGKQIVFYSFDPVSGIEGDRIGQIDWSPPHPAINKEGVFQWDLSPDGSRLAVVTGRDRVEVLTLSDRTLREIPARPPGGQFTDITWAPDGNGFFVISILPDSNNLLHVTIAGKVERLLSRGIEHQLGGALSSPDGRHLAFNARRMDSNVGMIENF